jgi:hypothetical protein
MHRTLLIFNSWKMVFYQNEAEFDKMAISFQDLKLLSAMAAYFEYEKCHFCLCYCGDVVAILTVFLLH